MSPITALPPAPAPANAAIPVLPDAVRAAVEQAAGYAAQASAAATQRAYASDWADWTAWCGMAGINPLPGAPAALGAYLAGRTATLSVATLSRRVAAIATAHRLAGHHLDTRHPAVRDVMRGIKRAHGVAPRRARAATTPIVSALAATCDASLLGARDRALLLIGFAAALRRSELVGLDLEDIEFTTEGVRLQVHQSKTDQEGEGATVGVMSTGTATCPVMALQTWLDAAGISDGRVFRSMDRHGNLRDRMTGEAITMVVQRRATMAGLDGIGFSAHSLRAGLATSAAAAGVSEGDIARQTRHRSVAVLRTYVRHDSVFLRNASGAVGL